MVRSTTENDFKLPEPSIGRAVLGLGSASLMDYFLLTQSTRIVQSAYTISSLLSLFSFIVALFLCLFALGLTLLALLTLLFETEHLWHPKSRLKHQVETYICLHGNPNWFASTYPETGAISLRKPCKHSIAAEKWDAEKTKFIKQLSKAGDNVVLYNLKVGVSSEKPGDSIDFSWIKQQNKA